MKPYDSVVIGTGLAVKREQFRLPNEDAASPVRLESGKTLRAEARLYAVGRQGVYRAWGLDKVGVEFDDRERCLVDDNYQTNVPHIYAAGDVIGFPALASISMEQGGGARWVMRSAAMKSVTTTRRCFLAESIPSPRFQW